MATLEGKRIVIIGGSSGIGFCVARASLLNAAEHVYIASSTKTKVDGAVARLLADTSLQAQGRVSGDVVDLGNTAVVTSFLEKIGEIDHLIITSGTIRGTIDFRTEDLSKHKGLLHLAGHAPETMLTPQCASKDDFDVRFWGAATAAQKAKIRSGGSITFTIGMLLVSVLPAVSHQS